MGLVDMLAKLTHKAGDEGQRWEALARAALRKPRARPRSLHAALAGKRVVVTGASSGIGKAIALEAAAHGASVLLVARHAPALEAVKREIEARGGEAQLFCADLSHAEEGERLVKALLADGPVDILVNNAGRSIRRSLRHAYTRMHDFERTMALNYFGAVRLTLGLLPAMRAQGSGHIINISSVGVSLRTPRFAAYVASKAALDAFSQIAAAECFGEHVYFTNVHMPLVRTPMIKPTKAYRHVPTLSPTHAARLALSALVTRKTHITPLFARWVALQHAIRPRTTLRVLNALYHMTSGSTDGGELRSVPAPPREVEAHPL